ncbi:MAG: type III-B CRISPR module RAMP protein Cmr1 [Verrucomicrobia bacterium]|nr:type III-B CRISPR module RAMP protein Cmr1 [Verrucomicrobiota bacterium]
MKTETFHLELITPCFCGGAEPERQAEIRAPSIRGQLRWWFRTLGGFKSLERRMTVRKQEAIIFGSTAGDTGRAGKLRLQVRSFAPTTLLSNETKNIDDLNAGKPFDPRGYLLFPLRKQGDDPRKRGVFVQALPRFELRLNLSGDKAPWSDAQDVIHDIQALLNIFAHLGSLGFRARRGMGALRPVVGGTLTAVSVQDALARFGQPDNVAIRELASESQKFQALIASENKFRDAYNTDSAHARNPIQRLSPIQMDELSKLAVWLRAWRQHGQMSVTWPKEANSPNPIPSYQKDYHRNMPGFPKARRDHNEGLARLGFPPGSSPSSASTDSESQEGMQEETYRPAIGLPIIQSFSSFRPRKTVNWGTKPKGQNDSEGRFASPVLLRPHKDAQGKWHALVIFVDAHKWPDGKRVYLNGQERQVAMVTLPDGTRSPTLYEAMKNDEALKPFTG